MDGMGDFISTLDGASLVIGLAMGLAVGLIFTLLSRANMKRSFAGISAEMKSSFDSLSAEALKKSKEEIEKSHAHLLDRLNDKSDFQTRQHSQELNSKKELIDQQLEQMASKLNRVESYIQEFEVARETRFGALDKQLQNLTRTTTSLQQALANNRVRGQWGERIAEDILQLMGFVKDIHYKKQSTIASGERPDFTFLLPNKMMLHMDSKFPLENYMKYLDANDDVNRNRYRRNFLKNVESHVASIKNRDYINARTVDCVLMFIPNEQIYRFIHEQDDSIIESALRRKVILCSPLTLYIVLSVIHQAVENFAFEQKSREIFGLIREMQSEWKKYTDQMDKLEKGFKTLQSRFNSLTGTRTRQLDRKFDKIEDMTKNNSPRLGSKGSANYQQLPPGMDDLPF